MIQKVRHETCLEYFRRRLKEGWKCIKLESHNAVLLSPDGIIRPIDLRNDVETLRPNGGGTNTNLQSYDGTLRDPDPNINYTMVDEETPDGYSTEVITQNSSYLLDTYNIPNPTGSGPINYVKVYCHIKCDFQENGKVAIRTHSTEYYGPEEDLTTSWVTYSNQWNTNPNTGSAWTWEELNDLEIGVALKGAVTEDRWVNCTQVYAEVDYTPATPKTSSDAGYGEEGTPLQATALSSSELGQSSDSLTAKIETPNQGGGTKLWT